jgi:PAS domain S-box-containing protein
MDLHSRHAEDAEHPLLKGGGTMGTLMRAHDWSTSPLGEPRDWSQSLVSVVGLLLNSKFPMFVAWGEKLGFLYNDSYAEILGAKHPAALGASFKQIWGEIWEDILPLIDAALSGEATYRENLPLLMQRKGYEEQTWFTFSYSPVFGDNGEVAGMFCACTETTEQVLAQRRREALLQLDERLRDVADTADLSFVASELLGETLGAIRVGYGVLDPDAGTISVERNWSAPGFADVAGLHQFRDYGSYIDEILAGSAVANADVEIDGRTAANLAAFRALGIRSHLDVPVVEDGTAVAEMFVHSSAPREWSSEDIELVREVAERTHGAIARRAAEQERRESEARFRLMADAVPQIIWITDGQGQAEFFNKQWSDYTGVAFEPTTAAEVAANFIHPEDGPATVEAYDQARREGTTFLVEHRIRSKDGSYRWFLVRGEPYRDDTGQISRWFGASVDIHDRKLAEAALRDLNNTLEAQVAARSAERDRLWKLSQDMLARADYDGMMSAVSPAWSQVLGWDEGELLSRPYATFMHPEDMPATLEAISQMASSRRPTRFENRIATKAGHWKHIEWTVAPEADGQNFIAIGRDLTDVRAREAELQAAETAKREADALYRAYFENTPEALFVIGVSEDGSFFVEEINPAHEAGVGLKLEDIRGKRVDEILPEEIAAKVVASYRRVIETGQIVQYREEFALDDDAKYWDTSLVPMRDLTGRIARIIGSSRNVTRQVIAEEALRQSQKMEAMGSLTGGVAHDFNNLLTPIIGSLDMLVRKSVGSERERRLIDAALQSAERAKTLVQRLLAFARRQPLQPVAVDLEQLVEGMVGLIGSTLGPTVDVRVNIMPDLPPANADPNQLEMALLNLAVNARDAMPEGGELEISARRELLPENHAVALPEGEYLVLAVSDNGVGMDADTRQRAIEPFFSTKGVGKGTGLGLSMVHGLAAQLGGGLTIESAPEKGTTISLWLPSSLGRVEIIGAAPAQSQRPVGRGTALLVDDDDLVRMSTADMLIDLGFEVLEAGSAQEALDLIQSTGMPDVLITDHLMPGMTGAELAHRIRKQHPRTPILIVSGYAEVEGVAPHLPRLTKPFRNAELAAMISKLLPDNP